MRKNVLNNRAEKNSTDDTISCHQLRWGKNVSYFKKLHGVFDVIIGSDIIYTEEAVDILFDTVVSLLKNEGTFLLAFARRNVSIDLVLNCADKHSFQWKCDLEDEEGIYIFTQKSI